MPNTLQLFDDELQSLLADPAVPNNAPIKVVGPTGLPYAIAEIVHEAPYASNPEDELGTILVKLEPF